MNTKKKTLSVLTMAATALLFAACDKDEVGGPDDSHISQEVLAAFNARYPGAQDVRWSLRGDYAVANFFFEAARTESRANNAAWFENANGQWAMTETNIDFAALPQAVREGFDASKYTEAEGWTRTGKVDKLERKEVVGAGGSEGVTVVYVIGVTRTADGITTGMDLYFSTEGVLVNGVTNAADDGYEDYIPEKPAAGIEQQIQGYLDDNGGGSVIDVDREYGGTEVELVCGGYKHELYFDAQGNRIYAKIEYGRRDIGSAVPEAIYNAVAADQQLSSPNDIDDIEKWSLDKATADGISVFWCVEVETRHKEVDIYVNDSPVRIIIPRPVIDMGNTGGNGLPVEDEIERFLNDRYPGAKVVERDYDDGCLELTILHENLRKEVLFDGRNNWLRTEWELHRLPQNILDAVQQAGYTLDDDEFECIETSGGMWYEFEARKDRREYNLRVDTNGNIEAYED